MWQRYDDALKCLNKLNINKSEGPDLINTATFSTLTKCCK